MGWFSNLFGSNPKAPEADIDELLKILDLNARFNRTDENGILSGWNWTEGEDGRWTQNQTVNPALQPGIDNFMARTARGTNPQLQQLMDARFEAMMNNPGIAPRPPQRERQEF